VGTVVVGSVLGTTVSGYSASVPVTAGEVDDEASPSGSSEQELSNNREQVIAMSRLMP